MMSILCCRQRTQKFVGRGRGSSHRPVTTIGGDCDVGTLSLVSKPRIDVGGVRVFVVNGGAGRRGVTGPRGLLFKNIGPHG